MTERELAFMVYSNMLLTKRQRWLARYGKKKVRKKWLSIFYKRFEKVAKMFHYGHRLALIGSRGLGKKRRKKELNWGQRYRMKNLFDNTMKKYMKKRRENGE